MTNKPKTEFSVVFILLALFALVVVRRAWIGDDAYITFRTVDNFLHGYGLVWNVGERVQVYTHPLWMFLLAGAYAITREIHFTSLAVSILISCSAAILLAARLARTQLAGAFAILTLILSKAFVDYSTSGLENPLSHLLLVLFVLLYLSLPTPKKSFWLAFLTSMVLLTRLDLALLLIPALLLYLFQHHDKSTLGQLIFGGLPLLAWEGFSLFYYGFLLPNTYYAKLNTGIPQMELTRQGIQYFLNALEFDPLTLLMLFVGILVAFTYRDRRMSALATGILLYLLYIVRIGGDFMEGRFLTAPLLLAVILLAQLDFESFSFSHILMIFGITLAVGLGAPNATLDFRDTDTLQIHADHLDHRGIVDERLNLATYTAPLALPRDAQPPTYIWAWQGTRDAGRGRELAIKFGLGFYGFNAGPDIYIIDQVALADPLLARLPSTRDIHWRVGHYFRDIPSGYERTLETGKNALKDPDLALFYDKLSLITRGPLFSRTRLLEILKMNLGFYNDLIHWDTYRYPEIVRIKADKVPIARPSPEMSWNNSQVIQFVDSGTEIRWDDPQKARWLELSLSSDDDFILVYRLDGKDLASQEITATQYPEGGLATHQLFIPAQVQDVGFDAIRILPTHGENFSLGHLSLFTP